MIIMTVSEDNHFWGEFEFKDFFGNKITGISWINDDCLLGMIAPYQITVGAKLAKG